MNCDGCSDYIDKCHNLAVIKQNLTLLIEAECFDSILDNENSKEFKALMNILTELNFHLTPAFVYMKGNKK